MRYDALFIDFYGTIADGDRAAVERTCARIVRDYPLKLSAEELAVLWGRKFFSLIDECNRSGFKSLYDCEVISLTQTLNELGIRDVNPYPYADMLKNYWSHPDLHPECIEVLGNIRVPICCVSNADEDDLQQAIGAYGLSFSAVVSSQGVSVYKPDRRIFQAALDALGIAPERVLHVGDSLYSDIFGAQSLGIKAVWIERASRISDVGSAQPDFRITNLRELYNIFD